MADEKKKKEKKHWFKDFRTELKKVTWQTPKQLAKNTAAVVVMVLIVAVIVFVLDFAFEALNKYGVENLKSFVRTNETTQVETNTTDANSVDVNIVDTNTVGTNTVVEGNEINVVNE